MEVVVPTVTTTTTTSRMGNPSSQTTLYDVDDDDTMNTTDHDIINDEDTKKSTKDKEQQQQQFRNYLYHLIYALQQLERFVDTNDNDNDDDAMDITEFDDDDDDDDSINVTNEIDLEMELEQYRVYHIQQLQEFITTTMTTVQQQQQQPSTISQLIDTIIQSLLHVCQLHLISRTVVLTGMSSSSKSKNHNSATNNNNQRQKQQHNYRNNSIYHMFQFQHLITKTSILDQYDFIQRSTVEQKVHDNDHDDDDDDDNDNDEMNELYEDSTTPTRTQNYNTNNNHDTIRVMDIVRRLLRSMAPIAIDIVAKIVSLSLSSVNNSINNNSGITQQQNHHSIYILLSIWVPIAPHILPLVTHYIQTYCYCCCCYSDTFNTNNNNRSNNNNINPLQYAKQLWMSIQQPSNVEQSVITDTVSVRAAATTTSVVVVLEQVRILLETTWFLCQIYKDQQQSHVLRDILLHNGNCDSIFDWLQQEDSQHHTLIQQQQQPSNANHIAYIIQWYALRIIGYIRNYTTVYSIALLKSYNVYDDNILYSVPTGCPVGYIHPIDYNNEEMIYQHYHTVFGYTYISCCLINQHIILPSLRTVRQHIPLHSYLIHYGHGLVFVKYHLHLLSSSSSSSSSFGTITSSSNNNIDMANTQQEEQQLMSNKLIRTSTTRQNMYLIATAMLQPQYQPILIAGPNGSGKSSIVREFANEFFVALSLSSSSSSNRSSSTKLGTYKDSFYDPMIAAPLLEIHVDDETDTKTLVGSYTATDIPGEFEWRPGALTNAVQTGQWVLFEDYDTIPIDIQASLEPLFKHRTLPLGNGTTILCHPNFRLFGTITTTGNQPINKNDTTEGQEDEQPFREPMMTSGGSGRRGRGRILNSALWITVHVEPLPINELKQIGLSKYPTVPVKILDSVISIFYTLVDNQNEPLSSNNTNHIHSNNRKKFWIGRSPSVRDLFKVLSRISNGIQFEQNASYITESQRTLCLAEIVDVFVAACSNPIIRREFITQLVTPTLSISADLGISYVECRQPPIILHDTSTEIGRVQIAVTTEQANARSYSEQFAPTSYSLRMMEAIGVCIRENEPTLLVGETGTGKTTILQHLAKCCGRELLVQNLSLQTDSADLLGGYRPLEMKHIAQNVYHTFVDLFTGTFSRKQNAEFLTFASTALQKEQWMKLSQCFRRAAQLGIEKLRKKSEISSDVMAWEDFHVITERFEKQRLACASGLAFNFTEGALIDAIRTGKWVLLDEINLASSETLQRLCGLLDDSSSSLTLTERGDTIAIKRHPSFRLFAAMNPATDAGKKDLPPSIRARFTEIFVDELLDPVQLRVVASRYISAVLPSNERQPEHTEIVITIVDLYLQCRHLADGILVDGSGQKPRYTLRTLSRALTAARTIVIQQKLPLKRALFEGFQLAFQGPLDEKSLNVVDKLLLKTFGTGVEKVHLDHPGRRPNDENGYELIKPFWIAKGPLDSIDWSIQHKDTGKARFILVPSTTSNLRRLARAIASGPWPLLLEGPTSAGKTSLIEYIAARCGHHVVRINNHEHTDIQEYTGGFASDSTGALKFVDGILVQALRLGHWVILDELNLAPCEVLEALNRLLDDNRELYIPEINETVRPHPSFRLFATQNPSGAYGGRKPLSRAFRNRFVEIQINDIPSVEMITILEKRCGCPPSHSKNLVDIMNSLRQRRSKSGIFLGKDGLITPRDLLRWADRGASSKYELGLEGYMLLAERLRSSEEQQYVKETIEKQLKVTLDIEALYYGKESDANVFLTQLTNMAYNDTSVDTFISTIAPTKNLKRLITLVHRCVKQNEPVLLVGDTGCGKTVTVQLLAHLLNVPLHTLNCHQTTETSDLIGGLRPVRGRNALLLSMISHAQKLYEIIQKTKILPSDVIPVSITSQADIVLESNTDTIIMDFVTSVKAGKSKHEQKSSNWTERISKRQKIEDADEIDKVWDEVDEIVREIENIFCRYNSLFEWADGPLVDAMKRGELILLDEISLADDAVLERLNSVLEPSRTIVLAEKGALEDRESRHITAHPNFQFFATMNPGGDFGKRELSPALRSRFTEIWVPPVSDYYDLGLVLDQTLSRCCLEPKSTILRSRILDYVEWFNNTICTDSTGSYSFLSLSLRDILSWARFIVESRQANKALVVWDAYRHGARLMHLDGLGLGSGLSNHDANSIRNQAETFMNQQMIKDGHKFSEFPFGEFSIVSNRFGAHPFWTPIGEQSINTSCFNFRAPTTASNVFRVLRALQVSKPILLEGSPGVGKTTLIAALAQASGHRLVRINLSEQTDISDLIGSDLPIPDHESSGTLGSSFRWCDGVLLSAIKSGDWVLLDELNLAPQSVLEGLNSCLDHRASVFVPELGQTFDCPSTFRVFAAQNPMSQGGGRKGLPKSFLNRFTKVFVDSLKLNDLQLIVKSSFHGQRFIDKMVSFNSAVSAATNGVNLGRVGSPWEFNLRDIFRWCELFVDNHGNNYHAGKSLNHYRYARDLYIQRFRTLEDRKYVKLMYDDVFKTSTNRLDPPTLAVSEGVISIGDVLLPRKILKQSLKYNLDDFDSWLPVQLYEPVEAVARCVVMGWPCVVVGKSSSGKTSIIRTLAKLTNSTLIDVCLSSSSDVSELVGCFEQANEIEFIERNALRLVSYADDFIAQNPPTAISTKVAVEICRLQQSLKHTCGKVESIISNGVSLAETLLEGILDNNETAIELQQLLVTFNEMKANRNMRVKRAGHFTWKDGALVQAMKEGHWLHLRNANLCSSSVLDRLNSVLEPNGYLLLAESGTSDDITNLQEREIRCHPNFRVFLSMNPEHGEMSRAMRNRCVEVSLLDEGTDDTNNSHDLFRSMSMAGIRSAHLAAALVRPRLNKNNNFRSARVASILSSIFTSMTSRGMEHSTSVRSCRSIFCTSQSRTCNDARYLLTSSPDGTIEPISYGLRIDSNWALYPNSNTIHFAVMVLRAFIGSAKPLDFDGGNVFSPAPLLKSLNQILNKGNNDIFLPVTLCNGRKNTLCDYLVAVPLTLAGEETISNVLNYFIGLASPIKYTIKFLSDIVLKSKDSGDDTPVGESTSETMSRVPHNSLVKTIGEVHTRRIPQLLKERLWLERIRTVKTLDLCHVSVLDVSYYLLHGKIERNTIDCRVTPFLFTFFGCLDDILSYFVKHKVKNTRDGFFSSFELLFKERDGLWNLLVETLYVPGITGRFCFSLNDFIAAWIVIRKAYDYLLPYLIDYGGMNSLLRRLDAVIEAISKGIFDHTKDALSGSIMMRYECAPLVPHQSDVWHFYLNTRRLCQNIILDRRSLRESTAEHLLTIQDCVISCPTLFVVDESFKSDLLGVLSTIQISDIQELLGVPFMALRQAVGEVPNALETHLIQTTASFTSKLKTIQLQPAISEGSIFSVEELVGSVAQFESTQETSVRLVDHILQTFSSVQIASCFESWCETVEDYLLKLFCSIMVLSRKECIHEYISSHLILLKKFVHVVTTQTFWDLADLRPYQAVIWLCEGNLYSDADWKCCIRKILPTVFLNATKRTWFHSSDVYRFISLSLDLPLMNGMDFSGASHGMQRKISYKESFRGCHITISTILSFVRNSFQYEGSRRSRAAYMTIENYAVRDLQSHRLVELLSCSFPTQQFVPYDVVYLFEEVSKGLSELLPDKLCQCMTSHIFNNQQLRDQTRDKLVMLRDGKISEQLRSCIDQVLLPLLRCVEQLWSAGINESSALSYYALSKVYIGLLKFHLLLPDVPIDPGQYPKAEISLIDRRLGVLGTQLKALELDALATTGKIFPENQTTDTILNEGKELVTKRRYLERKVIERPHSSPVFSDLYDEILQFSKTHFSFETVLSLQKLLSNVTTQEALAAQRVNHWRYNTVAFCDSIMDKFGAYEDVVTPLISSVCIVQQGIDLMLETNQTKNDDSIGSTLLSSTCFPHRDVSNTCSNLFSILQRGGDFSINTEEFRSALSLSILSQVVAMGKVASLSHKLLRVWIDVIDKMSDNLNEESFTTETTELSEEDKERDYNHQFPNHRLDFQQSVEDDTTVGSVLNAESGTINNDDTALKSMKLPESFQDILCFLHQFLFDDSTYVVDDTYRITMFRLNFDAMQKGIELFGSSASSHDQLAEISSGLVMALSLLSPSSQHFALKNRIFGGGVDFHHDPNPSETMKAAPSLRQLMAKTTQLLCMFPDNTILGEIARVCDRVSKLDLHFTSLGKVLTGLEVILKYCQDWEQHASVRVRLGEPLQEIGRIVTRLRKLELQSWSELLSSREERFARRGRENWAQLHFILRRFIVSLDEEETSTSLLRTPRWAWKGLSRDANRVTLFVPNVPEELSSILKVLDTFCLTAPLGQFNTRLQLLNAFANQIKIEASVMSSTTVFQLSASLHSLWRYYHQFTPIISMELQNQRRPFEVRLEQEIKLAKWDEQTYYAMAESSERNHRKLMHILQDYDKVLSTNVMSYLEAELSRGVQSDPNLTTDIISTIPSNGMFFPLESVPEQSVQVFGTSDSNIEGDRIWTDMSLISGYKEAYLGKLAHLSKRMIRLSEKFSSNFQIKGSATVNNFCDMIFERIESLRSKTTTRPMKERALTDLFKELKRNGYSQTKWSVPSEVRMMAELFQLPCPSNITKHRLFVDQRIVESAEQYFQRSIAELFRFRNEMSLYGSEHLTSRQLSMTLGFCEHGLYLLVQQRCMASCILSQRVDLVRSIDGLTSLTGNSLLTRQSYNLERLSVLRADFAYFLESVHQLVLLIKSSQHLITVKAKQGWSHRVVANLQEFLISVKLPVCSDDILYVSNIEFEEVEKMKESLDNAVSILKSSRIESMEIECLPPEAFQICESNGKKVMSDVNQFLNEALAKDGDGSDEKLQSFYVASSRAIESALMFAQTCTKEADNGNAAKTESSEASIWDVHGKTAQLWKMVDIKSVVNSTQSLLNKLVAIHESQNIDKQTRDCCTGFASDIGFLLLNALSLHDKMLSEFLLFYRGTTKLQYILTRIFRVLRSKGFCVAKSKDTDETETGNGSTAGMTFEDDKDGTGMGEGDGKTDVTDQIENEEQLLGLKGDKDDTNPVKPPPESKELSKDEAEKGMEMEGDFDGEMYDVPDDPGDKEQDEDTKEEEVDREMGQNESPNEEVIDEKMWDESDGEDNPDDAEEKFEQNSSIKGDGATDEMITNEGNEGKDEPNEETTTDNGQPEKQDDSPHEEESGKINDDRGDNFEENQGVNVRDETQQMDDQDIEDIEIDDDISIKNDTVKEDENVEGGDEDQDQSETAENGIEPVEETMAEGDTEIDPESENDSPELDPDNSAAVGSMQSPDINPDEAIDEKEVPKIDKPRESISHSGLGVRDKDGFDALQDNTNETLEQTENDINDSGKGDDGENMDVDPSNSANGSGSQGGQGLSDASDRFAEKNDSQETPNPFKNPGDASKFWHKKLNMIKSSLLDTSNDDRPMDDEEVDNNNNEGDEGAFEYTNDKHENTTQALGEADESEAMQLENIESHQEDDKTISEENETPKMDDQVPVTENKNFPRKNKTLNQSEEKENAREQIPTQDGANESTDDEKSVNDDIEMEKIVDDELHNDDAGVTPDNHVVSDLSQLRFEDHTLEIDAYDTNNPSIIEVEQTTGHSTAEISNASTQWAIIQSETHNLSRRLCEKLRLVMEPLVASKLRGDYRTGKRINMKRVIGYIASGYRKDKIWLRRTKPAKRNYRVLVAVDDSESMKKNGAGDMALRAMATLTVGMSQLEVGEVGIASFGNEMNLVHPFNMPFTSDSGSNIVQSFQFNQQRTQTALCIESAMMALEDTYGDHGAMQLVFMISDGRIERDSRSNIRRLIREMVERNILLVMIIVEGSDSKKDSIMNMKEVTFDKGRPQFKHFIEDYPFPYYIVLNDMQSLPEVLGDALKQWFEMLARIQSNTNG